MASVAVNPDAVVVALAPLERFLALHGDVHVPRSALRGAEVLDQPMRRLPRWRSLGTAVPGGPAYGTFRQRGRKEFVVLRRRQRAVRIQLEGHAFTAVVVGAQDPDALAARISALLS